MVARTSLRKALTGAPTTICFKVGLQMKLYNVFGALKPYSHKSYHSHDVHAPLVLVSWLRRWKLPFLQKQIKFLLSNVNIKKITRKNLKLPFYQLLFWPFKWLLDTNSRDSQCVYLFFVLVFRKIVLLRYSTTFVDNKRIIWCVSASTALGKHCETNRSKIILHQYLMSFNFDDPSEMVFVEKNCFYQILSKIWLNKCNWYCIAYCKR